MAFSLLLVGLLTGSLLAVLVGLLGARRKIGFGWAFLISVILTPFIGLIICLLSDPLPQGERKWGCLGTILGILMLVGLAFFTLLVLAAAL
ncbi:MAG: hypothetical protein ACTTKO_10445 [Candidatus Limimorpha sp.]